MSATLITGAGGDIGGAVARRLARDGAQLALAEHPAGPDLEPLAAELRSTGVDVMTCRFDVTDRGAVANAIDECVERLGGLSGLVNNAGRQGAFAPVDRYPLDDLRAVIDTNVVGAFQVLSTVAASMVAGSSGGAIVNLASMAGVSGAPNMAAYSASKAAVIGLTRSAAKDLAPHSIRVNAVSPAFIGPGAMWSRQVELQAAAASQYFPSDPAVVEQQMLAMIPLRRLGSLDEVANVIAFLLGPDASYLTGINVEIAGGSA